ncbi:hypothetical protein GCM10011614_34340 [Novosphingobium colocasiae]|uniref:Integrase catalytic domain-containing protein n=1 Tax=Novosphingobium colocasiae TaxID=1256513 RepID=A0A918UKR7_9SPHN|nr:hypothetical protein GCM10011614_34340 [Novosphingobium colocasiae]
MKPISTNAKSSAKAPAEQVVKDIRRQTRRHFSAEDTICIVQVCLRGEDSIAELCRKQGIARSLCYACSKEFMKAGKRRLSGDTGRAATTGEVQDLRREVRALKECVADLKLENGLLKAADQFHIQTTRPTETWQTDFTYFKITGRGWMYLSTVLDDFARYIIAWKLCTNMRTADVADTMDLALTASGCDGTTVLHKPRLISDERHQLHRRRVGGLYRG